MLKLVQRFGEDSSQVRRFDTLSAPRGQVIEVGPGGTTIRSGFPARGVTPERSVRTTVQKDIISTLGSLQRVEEIGSQYSSEFLTLAGKTRGALTSFASFLGAQPPSAARDFRKRQKVFFSEVQREFNSYRKLITGAAAAEKELNDLKKATINKDLSPIDFEAAWDQYRDELKRSLRLKQRFLRLGIPIRDNKDGDAGEYSKAFLFGETANSDEDIEFRVQTLMDGGMTQEQAEQQLLQEGF